ncbi:Zinc-finger domain of monoamine-oxidase A repressor R1 [Ostreococcus tauri]|uniref:Zinc-finger domain of monoamine-oxidase A repressor R1 n=2 Tax=Ostreococcus tauri TaxID=70448 RepID=A0A090M5B6_OSTTA|nr:Zinc-finger domain of monoamine-oxidase A repressor R1 [Ostreococcus tauri]CEF99415.1 Zinc-finger domain of monoamine-oxidase A repressor R1 [Ostreococcus tauri]|eukprot:XP_022839827.1 Zinc-finger domain of monoamine-oxidase A repressor R1 [Ostreococcus tauri]
MALAARALWRDAFSDSDLESDGEASESENDRARARVDDVCVVEPRRAMDDGTDDGAVDRAGGGETSGDGGATSGEVLGARAVEGVRVGRIGPELRDLRAAQGESREYYTMSHYDRLYGCAAAWRRTSRGSKTWCKDVHGPGCRECTSCHFCRQKTTDLKTTCQCGFWRKAPEGGRGRGVWCGWCLEMRMGENLDEARADPEWRCPVCRDICNCSGANCLRAKRNLFPTQQLTGEALQYGWQSVAHYLITTAIVTGRDAPPMLDLPAAYSERQRRQRDPSAGSSATRGTIPGMFGARSKQEQQAMALRAKVAESVRAAFGRLDDNEDCDDVDNGDDDGENERPRARGDAVARSRQGRASRGRRRTTTGDGYASSDGSELNSSDSESDVDESAPVIVTRARNTDFILMDVNEAPSQPPPPIGDMSMIDRVTSSDKGTSSSTATHHPKQKRARTDYHDIATREREHEGRFAVAGAENPEPRRVAIDVEEVERSEMQRESAGRPIVRTITTEYGETIHLREGDEIPAVAAPRRRRRRRLPRPDDAEQFGTINPEVVEAAQDRAVHAAAQEEDEETRAAVGEGECASILREVRDGAVDEWTYRDALVSSHQALRLGMDESETGIIVDEGELRAFCALVVRIARVVPRTTAGLKVISDARETLADPETFKSYNSTGRAIVLRALLRCSDHAAYQNVQVRESILQVLILIGELGEEYCLIRQSMLTKPEEAMPLPEHLQASISALSAVEEDGEEMVSVEINDAVALLLLERLEAAHVLLYASMAALRRSVRGPPLAGREELFCPTIAAFLSPEYAFKIKLRKQALRLIAAAVTAATRDWGDPKSPVTVALATNASEYVWPSLSNLLAADFPARSTTSMKLEGGSGIARAAIEGSARLFALLLRSGVWGWGKVEAAVVAPHTPATFWRSAGAPYRALAYRLYSRLLDVTPVYYGGIGAPLLKLWMLATTDPAAGESGSAGISRARARITRAAKRHPILFAAFPSSIILDGCEKSENVSLQARARWVAEVLRQASTTAISPKARVAAVAAANIFWEVLPIREAEVRGRHSEGSFAAASALILTTAASHLSDALLAPPPPKLMPMLRKTVELSSTRGGRESEARAETLSHALLTVASHFDAQNATILTTLIAILHEAMERPGAVDSANAMEALWSSLDTKNDLHERLGIESSKLIDLRDFIVNSCAKRAIERARYSASSKTAMQAAKGWSLALAQLAKRSSDSNWFKHLMPSILDALQPPAVPIGRSAAPPPISTADPSVRASLYHVLEEALTHQPELASMVDGDAKCEATPQDVFFVAILRAAIGEIAHALGGAEEGKGYTPLTENDRNSASRRLRSALGASVPPSQALEEVYRSFKPPSETMTEPREKDADAVTLTSTAIAALRFMSAFTASSPAAKRLVKTHVLSPIKAAMKRKDSHARRTLARHVNDLWAAAGLIQQNSKENMAPIVISAPPTPARKQLQLPRVAWPAGADEPCAFAAIKNTSTGSSVNVVGQVVKREPSKGVTTRENPKTGKKFDMLFVTLTDHVGDELRVQLIGRSARTCATALDVEGMPSDIAIGLIGLKSKGAAAWDPKEIAELIVNPENAAM